MTITSNHFDSITSLQRRNSRIEYIRTPLATKKILRCFKFNRKRTWGSSRLALFTQQCRTKFLHPRTGVLWGSMGLEHTKTSPSLQELYRAYRPRSFLSAGTNHVTSWKSGSQTLTVRRIRLQGPKRNGRFQRAIRCPPRSDDIWEQNLGLSTWNSWTQLWQGCCSRQNRILLLLLQCVRLTMCHKCVIANDRTIASTKLPRINRHTPTFRYLLQANNPSL